jgi:hypothetical protein
MQKRVRSVAFLLGAIASRSKFPRFVRDVQAREVAKAQRVRLGCWRNIA